MNNEIPVKVKLLPIRSNGCKQCPFSGHNGGFSRYEKKRICCDAPGVNYREWKHPDKVKEGESPSWCPLQEVES